MSPGNTLRVLVVICCLGALAIHLRPRVARVLFGIPPGDIGATLLAHQDRIYRWEIRRSGEAQTLASFSQSLGWRDTFFFVFSSLRIERGAQLPGLDMLSRLGLEGQLALDLGVELDDRWRLSALSADGSFAGLSGLLRGSVDNQGLLLHYHIPTIGSGQTRLDHITPHQTTGMIFALVMPVGLEPGTVFSQLSLGLEPTAPYLVQQHLEYRVIEAVPDFVGVYGPHPCLRLEVYQHGEQVMDLWVDAAGVVHRAALVQPPLEAVLTRISDAGGDPLWPPHLIPEPNATTNE